MNTMSTGPATGVTPAVVTTGSIPTVSPGSDSPRSMAPGILFVIGSCTSLQLGASIATSLFPQLGPWGVTSLRMLFAAVILLVVTRPRVAGWTGKQWRSVVLFGLALAGMNGFFYAGIARIPLGAGVAIEFLGPLALAAILSRRIVDFLWVLLALAGMAVLGIESVTTASAALDPLGVVCVLIAGAFWAVYVLTSAQVGRTVPGTGGLAVAMAVAAVVLAPVGGPSAVHAFSDPKLLVMGAVVGLMSSVIPYTLELKALRRLPNATFSILLSLEPAFAALFGFLLLHQVVGPLRLLAIALVILASMGTTLSATKVRRPGSARRRGRKAQRSDEWENREQVPTG